MMDLKITTMGDSKTAADVFQSHLKRGLENTTLLRSVALSPVKLATGGWTVSQLDSATDAWIAGASDTPTHVLINIGVNDVPGTSQASFKASLASVLDKVHAAWPSAQILVMRVWKQGFDSGCDNLATWISDVLATRGPWAAVGPDERVFLKLSDNGVSLTSDGVHPNNSGYVYTAREWQIAMGYP